LSGFSAALWLLGLLAGASVLRTSARYDLPDRLRDALVLGIAIPFALGFVHALYPVACWFALAICVAVAVWRDFAQGQVRRRSAPFQPPYVLIGALVAVSWPQLMRPLLDGDSLSYHLPNAASWVQTHSLWTTATRYWWYPPASELFASALYAVSGPFALPWCGFAPLAMLGLRIYTWARVAYACPLLLADALAAATITAYPLAIQGGTLQNDVWLAAFFLESLWLMRTAAVSSAAMRSLAITALIKPQGWLLAAFALVACKARRKFWLAAASALALWIARDAILWNGAILAPASGTNASIFGSTIAAHGLPALATLARVSFAASPFALVALAAAIAGPAIAPRDSRLAWPACAAALLFFVLPFGYATSVAQLATGASLRFAAPATALGALILARAARRAAAVAVSLLLASTLFGIWYVLAIFWNDGATHVALAFAALAVAVAAAAYSRRVLWPSAVALALGVVIAAHLAARHPIDYYADALKVDGTLPGVYRWISTARPAAVGGWGLRLGVVNVLSPTTRTVDLADIAPCAQARSEGLVLVAVAQSDRSADANVRRLDEARKCGRVLYRDTIAIVAQPSTRAGFP
jgi:hypothetical protein